MTSSTATATTATPSHHRVPDWVSLFAGVGMMTMVGLVIDPANDVIEPQTLGVIAGLGYLLGFVLGELRASDLLAHLISLVMGFAAALVAVEPRATWNDVRTGAIVELARRNVDRGQVMIDAFGRGDPLPDDVASIGIALTIWLVGYGAAWMLFRRGWYVWSMALPACVMLTSLALDRDQDVWPALVFAGLAIAQGASATATARTAQWSDRGLAGPRNVQRIAALAGLALAGIVVASATYAALTIPPNAQDWVSQHAQELADTVTEQIDRLPNKGSGSTLAGNYGEFADEFKVGDGIASGETLIASLRAADQHYLAARKFDNYDGAGWSSTFGVPPELDGAEILDAPPRIAFGADQEMHLPDSVILSRNPVSGEIQLYGASGGLLLTLETHLSISGPTAIQVAWQPVDMQFAINDVDISQVPLDLQSLVGLLRLARFDEDDLASGVVTIADAGMRGMIDEEIESLMRYPVVAEIGWDESLGIVLSVRGRLPIYTDIEAVFAAQRQSFDTYSATGLVPNVDAATLQASARTYPDSITSSYLQLPDTVSDRTRSLAAEIVADAGATDPYTMAKAIETYLRSNFSYLLQAGPAPDGEDIVDYFLFESGIGRCDHFASSMVVMLRALGVPARIVTGLAPVSFDAAAGAFQYRSKDAHAWVEVYFSEYGWIPFEPTPSQDVIDLDQDATSQQGPIQPTPTPQPEQPDAEQTPTAAPDASPGPVALQPPPTQGGTGNGISLTSFPGVLFPILLALAAAIGGLLLLWKWPLRHLRPAASFYYRLQRLGKFFGVKPDGTMTPAEYAAQYGTVSPRHQGAAASIAEAYTDERYGPPEDGGGERGLAGWLEARKAFYSWRPWRRKGR
ncbi:MAG: transglutaminase domain-containing protein [Thermomicrobiales bacterium]|nr:transglutaminase domain-containing protein [Thermomicrobiales bacterium]